MVKLIGLLVGLGALIVILKSATFGGFLGGATTAFSAFGIAVSGSITPQMVFAFSCVGLILIIAVATIFI